MIAKRALTTSLRAVAWTAASGLLLAGCARSGGDPPPREGTLVVALVNSPTHLDPRVATDQSAARLFDVTMGGLVSPGLDGIFIPDLAESWEILEDGRRYRFHLRSGVTFHDGRAFGSADVVWTFQSILDGTVVTPKRGAFAQLESVEAVDGLTVDFHLSEPYGAFLANVTSYLGIVPAGSMPDDFNRSPVGTGPFRLVEKRPDKLTLERFADYWDGPPRLERLVLREVPDATVRALELRKGSVQLVVNDLAPDVIAKFREDPAFRVVEDPGGNYVYVGINLEDPVLSDAGVRRALAHAIDRPRIVESLWRGLGVVTETLVRPGHWAHHEGLEAIAYSPETAMRLLDTAGYTDPDGDGPGTRFTLSFKTSTDETGRLQGQIIQEMLARIGVGIDLRSYEFATFYNDIKQGNFQLFSLTWTGTVDPDIYAFILHSEKVPPAGANRGRYRNPEFDRAIEAGAAETDPALRRPFYLEAQEILARDLPYISLFIKNNVAVMPSDLEGYRNYPNGELLSLRQVGWAGVAPPG